MKNTKINAWSFTTVKLHAKRRSFLAAIRLCRIAALIAVIGFTLLSCDDGSTRGGTDSALNGTWSGDDEELTFKNGSFEASIGGSPLAKGTYTTSGGSITMTVTHVYGGNPEWQGLLESKWYTRAEIKRAFEGMGYPITDAELNQIFATQTEPYSVSGGTLIFGSDTYTKTGNNPGGGSNANVVGTWTGTYTEKVSGLNMTVDMTYVFRADGTLYVVTDTYGIIQEALGTYTVSGNTVRMRNNANGVTDDATMSGNTMTVKIKSGATQIDTVTLRKI